MVNLDEAAALLKVSPRSVVDWRWRLRGTLIGHRAREELRVGMESRRNAVGSSLDTCHEF